MRTPNAGEALYSEKRPGLSGKTRSVPKATAGLFSVPRSPALRRWSIPARLKILLPRPDARPTGPVLGGTWKQVTGQQEGSPQKPGACCLRCCSDGPRQRAAVAGVWACGGAWCGPDFAREPFRSQQLPPPLPPASATAASLCPMALAHPAVSATICSAALPSRSSCWRRAGGWGTARSRSPCSRTRSPVGSGAHKVMGTSGSSGGAQPSLELGDGSVNTRCRVKTALGRPV